ncbi:spore photoproduct lyase family protein [Hydrogenoanaerobacterium sp.]|uniref:SPL family radical SAM protein n=1 Tax=Hydrogenoanaerobacterium sp. TaxID=2953763 RepID=UPI0028A10D2C|nr:spore photoproduct lyase [Hydrogenoanaerobacterium sp.]
MKFDNVYYESNSLDYDLGRILHEKFNNIPWIEIESHNRIEQMQAKQNSEFAKMKRNLIIGIRKTHKYVENHKVSDYLVPYTSSGCSAMCLYCYLVCNYNKCAYLRLFVNREQMLEKLIKTANKSDRPLTFEIGSNSDLVLENTITRNLEWTITEFGRNEKGFLTFPTKFDMVEALLPLNHRRRVIFRMSVNPQEVINKIELGTSPLKKRINTINQMCEAGYPTGILIAPVVLTGDWRRQYSELLTQLADTLSEKAKKQLFIEIIFMTYSYIHRMINNEAFPSAVELYDKELMTVRGRGKYCYRPEIRSDAEEFLRAQIEQKLGGVSIIYVV